MPRIIKTPVYELHELSDAAKEKARTWFRETIDWDWHESVCDDFEGICRILGITLHTHSVRLYGGGTRQNPCIYFSGFWSQGDGACYEGTYAHARQTPQRIREYAPQDVELHRIADALQGIQRCNFYQLRASFRQSGHYYHAGSMAIDVERDSPAVQPMTAYADDHVTQALRDLADWLYRQLEREWEYQSSDETVDDGIAANTYTFTAEGRRFG